MISHLLDSSWVAEGGMGLGLLSLIVGVGVGVLVMWPLFKRGEAWRSSADYWMARAVRAEDSLTEQIRIGAYRIPPAKAPNVLREIFRPLGATPREKEFREHRALHAMDHHTRHFAEGVTDGEVAREIMQFCVGGYEVEE